jgi:thiamine pyridinylase
VNSIKQRLVLTRLGLSIALAAGLSCASQPRPELATPAQRAAATERTFTAVLFPYIPDSGRDGFATLIATLETWFEADNPEIDLQITIDPSMDLYDSATLATLLGTGQGSFDMVEVDTLLLGDLVSRSEVQPLPFPIDGFGLLPTAVVAATVGSTVYAVPTYLCGNYIYSWDEGIRGVHGGQALVDFLTGNPNPGATALVGNFAGSWTLPSLYVDAWADTHTNEASQVATSYDLPLDPATMSDFQPVVDLCGTDGGPCLDGTYKDNTLPETAFAHDEANGFIGFSERLYYILEERGGNVALPSVISAPIGADSNPVMFVDGLVLNRVCTGQCAADAASFSGFMSSLRVRTMIAFSDDVSPQTFPRYLLQALASFYTTSPGSENLVYQQLYPFVQASVAFPNQRFPEARLELNPALQEALGVGMAKAAELLLGRPGGGHEIRRAAGQSRSTPPAPSSRAARAAASRAMGTR